MSTTSLNDRYVLTLGKVSGALAEQLQRYTAMASVVDVVRLALATLRLLVIAERAGWTVVLRAGNGDEFDYTYHRPNELVARKVAVGSGHKGVGGTGNRNPDPSTRHLQPLVRPRTVVTVDQLEKTVETVNASARVPA